MKFGKIFWYWTGIDADHDYDDDDNEDNDDDDYYKRSDKVPNLGLGPKWDQSAKKVPKKSLFCLPSPKFQFYFNKWENCKYIIHLLAFLMPW